MPEIEPSAAGPTRTGFDGGAAVSGSSLGVGNRSGILPMLWIGFYTTVLNLFTLTIFRFWGRTQFRRRLWSDTYVGEESLEYTGRGLELFIGFIIAIFVLMIPSLAVILGAQILLQDIGTAIALTVFYLVFFILIGAAIFLARRYHLSRTRYRGIRFAQTGSAIGYGFATFGYAILTGITLGWFGPAARLRLSAKLWNKAYYGSEKFSFVNTPEAAKEPVYLSFALAWVGTFIAYGAWFAIMLAPMIAAGGDFDPADMQGVDFIIGLYASMIPLIIVIALFVAWHEAVMIRRIVKSLEVGGLRLSSRMSTFDIIELAITNTLLLIFTLGFGYMAIQMRVWKRIANRMSLEGEIDFDAIKQTEHDGPSQGEGLADGLDIVSNF